MKKEEILKQIEELKKQVELLNEPKFDVGKWYIYYDHLFNYQTGMGVYGFDSNGWVESSCTSWQWNTWYQGLRPATDKEVEEALIKEAVKRGYKQGNFKNLGNSYQTKDNHIWVILNHTERMGDCVLLGNEYIFSKGKWAEIIKDSPIMVGGYEVNVTEDNGFKIGCKSICRSEIEKIKSFMLSHKFTKVSFDGIETDLETINKILNL